MSWGWAAANEEPPPPQSNLTLEIASGFSESVSLSGGVEPREMGTREYAAELEYEIVKPGEHTRIYHVGLEWSRDEFDGLPQPFWPDELNRVGIELARTGIRGKWLTHLSVAPMWRAAGNRVMEGNSFGSEAIAVARYSAKETLRFWLGARVDTLEDNNDLISPIIGFEWDISPQWHLMLGVPKTALTFAPSEQWEFGIGADLKSDIYAVENKALGDAGLPEDVRLKYLDVRLGLQVAWRPRANFRMEAKVGTVAVRELEYTQGDARHRLKTRGLTGVQGSLNCVIEF